MRINKRIAIIVALLFITTVLTSLFVVSASAATGNTTEFAGGTGTAEDPYLISTKEQLNNVRNNLAAHYKLIADIVFDDADFKSGGAYYNSGKGWKPIGDHWNSTFKGTFDGNNKKIVNLQIHDAMYTDRDTGLFGYNSGIIKNLIISDSHISSVSYPSNIGCIVGQNEYVGIVENCSTINSKLTSSAGKTMGGIVGYNEGIIKDCSNQANITSSKAARVGGICGSNAGGGALIGLIQRCVNSGRITLGAPSQSGARVGGIAGTNGSESIIEFSANTGSVSVNAESALVGGISGDLYGTIQQCYNAGSVDVTTKNNLYAGGILGLNESGVIENSYNIAPVSGSHTGYSGEAFIGGVVGKNASVFDTFNCYAACSVSGKGSSTAIYVGYVCGYNSTSTIENCYYLGTENNAVGFGDSTRIYSVSSEAFSSSATFNNFDFSTIWVIQNDSYAYPQLINNQHVCNHVFTSAYSNDDNYHWNACENKGCTTAKSKTQHIFDHACDTTCVCGYVRTITHNFTGAWQKDTAGHWHICKTNGCNITDTKVAHSYDHACDTTCECGYVRTVSHNFTDAWHSDTDGHWHICENDGCIATDTKTVHTPGAEATETEPQKCTVCGYVITPVLEHSICSNGIKQNGQTATCTTQGWKDYYKCSGCNKYYTDEACTKLIPNLDTWKLGEGKITAGHKLGELVPKVDAKHTATELASGMKAHYFCDKCNTYFTEEKVATTEAELLISTPTHIAAEDDGDCTTDIVCTECGKVMTEGADNHTGGTATCTDKAKCSVCHTEYGTLASHKDDDGNGKCDVCTTDMSSTSTPDAQPPIDTPPVDTPPTNDSNTSKEDDNSIDMGLIIAIVAGSVILGSAGTFALMWFVIKKKS